MREDASEGITDLLESYGWTEVARPALRHRQALIGKRLAVGKSIPLEEIRFLQGQWALIAAMLDEPRNFFDVKDEP